MSHEVMHQILHKHLRDLQDREGLKKLRLDLDVDAKEWLIRIGISREYGARPLARVIQRYLLNPLSRCLLEETIQEGDTVVIRLTDKKDGLVIKPSHRSPLGKEDPVPGLRHLKSRH